MLDTNKTFFNPGDIVIVKHDIPNKPIMVVMEKITKSIMHKNGEKDSIFIGIKCRWFDLNCVLREAVWSTKDLIHVE